MKKEFKNPLLGGIEISSYIKPRTKEDYLRGIKEAEAENKRLYKLFLEKKARRSK
jgi:hypothetical protein